MLRRIRKRILGRRRRVRRPANRLTTMRRMDTENRI